ncbi:MAG: gliding motility-related protein [Ignavibacteria bacterium]|nr:gliding motility-related protein [Ignavibacteria bacterium]
MKKIIVIILTIGVSNCLTNLFAAEQKSSREFNSVLNSLVFFRLPVLLLLSEQNLIKETLLKNQQKNEPKPPLFLRRNFSRYQDGTEQFGRRSKSEPPGLKYSYEMDSSDVYKFTQKEEVDSLDISYPTPLTLDEYLALRKKAIGTRLWDSMLTSYDLKRALSGGDLARLLSQSTGLMIPVPPNPLMGLFGKPQININVNGEVNLRLGWRWDSQNLGTVSAFGQTQSSPIFSQDIRLNLSGSIGDKLKLGTDWNTKSTFDYNNKFKIGYEGEDDEIIKLIELGNVTLPLQSSLISGGQALFGVRADFQFGPLFLKTLFSQRRGERKFVDVRGGVSKQPFSIRAYDYAKNHFYLDTSYISIYKEYFKYSTPITPTNQSAKRINQIEVWESQTETRELPRTSQAVAYADLPPIRAYTGEKYPYSYKQTQIQAGIIETGRFGLMDSNRYEIDYNLGTITILNPRQDRTYAVAYRVEGPTLDKKDDLYYGTFISGVLSNTPDTLVLKLIYRPNLQPGFKSLWSRQMKNIYSINATNINTTDTKVNVWYINKGNDSSDVLQGAADKIVTILGVDQVNSLGQPQPDGQFDLRPPFFNLRTGEIIFPHPEPFRGKLRDYFTLKGNPDIAEQYVYNEIYDTTYDIARRNTNKDRFVISGEVSGKSTGKIALGAYNLAPGSVRVSLDGVPLRENEDYMVDYYAGNLTIRNQRANLPNANLRVEYEQHDIFNISTRTLTGIRGDLELLKTRTMNSMLGFTLMHYNQSAIIDRVRLGEEPVSNSMFGFDGKFQLDAPWLTRALNWIPFYDTKTQSSMGLRGEWAMMLPEPNTRYSSVPEDNNEPVVYIDDFEGAQRYISLGLNPTQWIHASQPQDSTISLTDEERSNYRGKMFWFQHFIPIIDIQTVWPNKSYQVGRQKFSPLEISFNPNRRGIYNKNINFVDTLNPAFIADRAKYLSWQEDNRWRIWGGMQRLFSSFNTNFDTENIEYIEITMHTDGDAKMFLELGQISEDIIPNKILDTEDGITSGNPMPNGIIDVGEDVGIDAANNAIEKDEINPRGFKYPLNLENDPARDDYKFDFSKDDASRADIDFENYNNFEGNASVSETGQFPDAEILNTNNGQSIALDNSFFGYEINLDRNPNTNPQIVGGNNGWWTYRIPIRKPSYKVGNPLFSNIQYIRVWFKGGSIKLQIADWKLVGSQWQRVSNFQPNVAPDDSVLQLGFVNREDNSGPPNYYCMPPGVEPPVQIGGQNTGTGEKYFLNEQSLSVNVKNLRYGEERMAVRIFRPVDLFYYKRMKFFIHADATMPEANNSTIKAYAYVRFGIDSANYYEYRTPLVHDRTKCGWKSVDINLNELTAIKQERDTSKLFERYEKKLKSDPLTSYAIKGNPILTKVQFFGAGIANPSDRFPNELSTTLWIDELRLISPEKRAQWAGVSNMDVKFADLASINASFSNTQPNFHRLEERFGDRITSTNWTVTMQGNIDKFAPNSFTQMKIPITYTHSELLQNPEFVANNDINLEQAATDAYNRAIDNNQSSSRANSISDSIRKRSQRLVIQDSWALTGVKLAFPTSFFLITETINKMAFGYSYSQEFERSPLVAERFSWIWRLNAQYSTNITKILEFQPLKFADSVPVIKSYSQWKVNFLPASFSASLNMSRRRITEQSRFLDVPSPVIREFSAQKSAQFTWKVSENGLLSPSIDYTVNTNSTLLPLEFDPDGRQRTGSQIASAMFFKDNKFINLGENNLHTQNIVINVKPKLPDFGGVNNLIDMSGSYSTNYTWNNPMQPDPAIRDIAKSASNQTSIRFNTGFKLKSAADKWFGTPDQRLTPQRVAPDTTTGILWGIAKVFKTIFLDFEKIDFVFNQTNNTVNPGVLGNLGFDNFWARGITGRESLLENGPSFAYQLGLITNPHGGFTTFKTERFPYFGFRTYAGLRPANAALQENYNQNSQFEIRTSRPLWEGATLDMNWKSGVGFNKNQTVLTDSAGVPQFTNIIAMESLTKTYFSMPTFFGYNIFGNDIENVVRIFNERKAQIQNSKLDTMQKAKAIQNALAESFHDGLEIFSFFKGKLGKYLPAVNWSIRWEGIEKWSLWGGYAKRVTLEHNYQSTYTENAQITDIGKTVLSQQAQFGFQPLIGITMGFDEKLVKGILSSTIKYNTITSYQVAAANQATITQQATEELSIQSSYTMRGFSFPLFGINMKNDLEVSFMASYKSNKRATFDILTPESYEEKNGKANQGRILDGNKQIMIEPRARYSIDNRVTASFFVRYEGTFTEGAAQPGFSTVQVGFDVRISLAGGR